MLEINIHLRLPASLESDSPLVVGYLWTILPLYSHHFEGLSESVRFRSLYLTSTEGDIIMNPVRSLALLAYHNLIARHVRALIIDLCYRPFSAAISVSIRLRALFEVFSTSRGVCMPPLIVAQSNSARISSTAEHRTRATCT